MAEKTFEDYIHIITSDTPIKIIFSNCISGDYKKITFERIKDKFYISKYTEKQVFNENIFFSDLIDKIIE